MFVVAFCCGWPIDFWDFFVGVCVFVDWFVNILWALFGSVCYFSCLCSCYFCAFVWGSLGVLVIFLCGVIFWFCCMVMCCFGRRDGVAACDGVEGVVFRCVFCVYGSWLLLLLFVFGEVLYFIVFFFVYGFVILLVVLGMRTVFMVLGLCSFLV